jgi:glycosyltransferase involved in cell wall biosynthesis
MKIIHLILGKANPERMNGVNKVVHALATHQSRAGWNLEVWGITPDVAVNYPAREFTTRLFRAGRNPFQLALALEIALAEAAAEGAVVHLHGGFIPAYYSVAQLLKVLGVPYVMTPHGAYNTHALRKNLLLKRLYQGCFEHFVLRNAAVVHCLGQSEVQGVKALEPELETCLLPYGYEGETSDASPDPHDTFRVGFCGRLDERSKGLDCLIAGFGEFARQSPAAELWIIGDGPDRARVARWAAKLPAGQVKLLGSRYGAEKKALLTQLDAFAHPSHYEGLPTAVLEAAALGIPCVVTEATNLGSYIRDYGCGQVVETACPEQLAASIIPDV